MGGSQRLDRLARRTSPARARSSFWGSESCVGTSTTTSTSWSPRPAMRRRGMPLPRTRSTVPDWVPGGTRKRPLPSSVGTSTSPPRAAVGNVIGIEHTRSSPTRRKKGCSSTRNTSSRSPAGRPGTGTLPAPSTRRVAPFSTPGGMVTSRVRERAHRPTPRHFGHGFDTMRPVALHLGHGRSIAKGRSPCSMRTRPRPAQLAQRSGVVPGAEPVPVHASQVSLRSYLTSFVQPNAASSKVSRTSFCSTARPPVLMPRAPSRSPKRPSKCKSWTSKGMPWKGPPAPDAREGSKAAAP
jgi:hypothetical protein